MNIGHASKTSKKELSATIFIPTTSEQRITEFSLRDALYLKIQSWRGKLRGMYPREIQTVGAYYETTQSD